MKKPILLLLVSIICYCTSAQFIARMDVKEPIPGICDDKNVYALFSSFKGQAEPVCPVLKEEISKRLNSQVAFLKENPKYKDKGMVHLVINCKGKVVQCEMDNKTKSPELDQQIIAVFNTLGEWKAGKLDGNNVDSTVLYSFTIKKGIITFN